MIEDKVIPNLKNMGQLTIIVLVYNENLHIERCINSAKKVADDVLIVDSYSTDNTLKIAHKLGARVLQNNWVNYATQLNWALNNGDIRTEWVMRLDADEYLDEKLITSLKETLSNALIHINGFEVNRKIYFMGREIRHGGMAPLWVTRFWRNGQAQCESRWMDEHIVLFSGHIARMSGAIVDENLNTLSWWTQKHNAYASREAVDLLDLRYHLGLADKTDSGLNSQARFKRWLKIKFYAHMPLGLRPWLYFFYRAILRLGILDGTRGMIFHTLQGLWYRMLVDAKVAEVERAINKNGLSLHDAIKSILNISHEVRQPVDMPQDKV